MAHRGTEAPMDFQYDNPRVPSDPNSPFTRFTALKRTHSDLRSPTPNPPALAPPNSEPFLFPRSSYQSSPPLRSLPPPPHFRRASTTTPRSTPLDMSDFTDPELFTSATPPKLTFRGTTTTTPGRTPSTPRGRTTDGAITKLKRPPRATSAKHTPRKPLPPLDLDSDADADPTTPPPPRDPQQYWTDTATHRDLPLIISQFVQVLFNASLTLLFLYFVLSTYLTIRHDVHNKLSAESDALVAASNTCAHSFLINRCAPHMRVPALAKACSEWERCMERDHSRVGKARISAQTFAEIIEGFVAPVSYRTMGFAIVVGVCALFVPNFALGLYRARAVGHPAPILAAAVPPIAERFEYALPAGGTPVRRRRALR